MVFRYFSFIFLSNWKPRGPGFPGNPIGNPGGYLRVFVAAILGNFGFFLRPVRGLQREYRK